MQLTYEQAQAIVGRQLSNFVTPDDISTYARDKYIHMATNMTYEYATHLPHNEDWKVEDFVHGLTHIFHFGIIG